MKVTKVHRAIRFEVKAMFAYYIKFNTDQRSAGGKDECKRTFYKMTNNAPYGKYNRLCWKEYEYKSSN